MKRLLIALLTLVLTLGLAIPMATPTKADGGSTITVVSNAGTQYKYWGLDGSTFPASASVALSESTSTDFTDYAAAIAATDSAYTIDPSGAPFAAGTQWIAPYLVYDSSQSKNRPGGPDFENTSNSRGLYTYKKVFTIPDSAYITEASAAIGGDNYAWLYLNGNPVLSPRDSTQTDSNHFAPPSSTASIPAAYFINGDNVLVAEVQNGISNGQRHGPTAVVFSLEVTYDTNQPPDCSEAYADQGCLWPPNHQFVDIKIMNVTDPDDDPVTITITGITSDEPTASDKGSGGAKHSPDAYGVGTDVASVRVERSGQGDGRVYVVSFTASDGHGGECQGSVTVNVPHDQSDKTCPAVNSGQNYDATAIN
jgi:hypothetical protein